VLHEETITVDELDTALAAHALMDVIFTGRRSSKTGAGWL
jgi:hypothetical protein